MSESDSRSMVEVIAEFRETQQARLEAAQSMIVPHVIRAFLDGADPKELAKLCGFTDTDVEESPLYESLFGSHLLYGSRKIDAVSQFASWLSQQLTALIHEVNTQGG